MVSHVVGLNWSCGGSPVVPRRPPTQETTVAVRISKRAVDALVVTDNEHFLWDSDLLGFGVRVRPSGAKTYVLRYRAGSGRTAPTRRVTLGAVGKLTPDQARDLARKMLATVAHGGDPAAYRAKDRVALTIAELAERYLHDEANRKRKPSTAKLYAHYLRFHVVPRIGLRKVHTLTRAEVSKLHRDIGATAAVTANRVLAILSGIFTYGQREGLVPLVSTLHEELSGSVNRGVSVI